MNAMVDNRTVNGLRVKPSQSSGALPADCGRYSEPAWLCVQYEPGALALATAGIRDLRRHDGSEVEAQVFAPTVRILVPRRNQPAERRITPCWPGYLLCMIPPADWHLLKRVRGVSGVLSVPGDRLSPAWLPDEVAGRLLAMASARGVIEAWSVPERLPPLAVGAAVQITGGAMAGHTATVALSSEERVAVLMEMMGRKVRTVIERRYVAEAAA